MEEIIMLESGLIRHCAPTLAGIKSAGLFNYKFTSAKLLVEAAEKINKKLNECGVYVEIMCWKGSQALIYAYRKTHLAKELQQEGVLELLKPYGYEDTDAENCIAHLKSRLFEYDCFPHEIGVFLGYPLEDVKGFIKYEGRNCKCCGIWKVYCDECEAQKAFDKIERCTQIYRRAFLQGRSIYKMTVSA